MKRGGLNVVDRVGQRYGRLVVVRREGSRGTAALWLCQCDCGKTRLIPSNSLRDGYAQSCGCKRASGTGSRPSYGPSKPPGHAARNITLKGYVGGARLRGIEWALSSEDFFAMVVQPCHWCGVAPSRDVRCGPRPNGNFVCSGLDRVDNTRGYFRDNVVPCCTVCNHAKKDMTADAFGGWLDRIANFRTTRKEKAAA